MEKEEHVPFRIALIGPESTSKSTLSENLAKHYKTVWVPEYCPYLPGRIKSQIQFERCIADCTGAIQARTTLIKKST